MRDVRARVDCLDRLIVEGRHVRVLVDVGVVRMRDDVVGRVGFVTVLTADRRLEIPQAASKLSRHLRQSLRSEDEQRDHQDEQQVGGLEDVADHWA
jgi:hypothetical protein